MQSRISALFSALVFFAITMTANAATTHGVFSLSASSYTVAQKAGEITISVTRTGGTAGAARLYFTTVHGTAVPPEFAARNGTLIWADGEAATKTFVVPISTITPFTGTKQFGLRISNLNGGGTLGTSTSTVTINGSGTNTASGKHGVFSLSAASYSVAQSAGQITITVTRTGGAAGGARLYYFTQSGTAKSPVFTPRDGAFTWKDGESSARTVIVPISTTAFSGTKQFSVGISNLNGGGTLGISSAPVLITGSTKTTTPDAGAVALSTSSYSVAQTAKSVTVTVQRTGGTSGAVSVGYGTANSTALSGKNYVATSGVLKWANGESSAKSFSIAVDHAKNPLTFVVAVAAPSGGATLANPKSASVTIAGTATAGNESGIGETAAARLLNQATFGATLDSVASASSQSYDAWFTQQIAITPTYYLPQLDPNASDWTKLWWKGTLNAPDQLRQRAAFALSEIFVVSGSTQQLNGAPNCQAAYLDLLLKYGLGNFRTLLEQVTLSPNMGLWLSMFRNNKPNAVTGVHADENYAREIMQLFTVGLVKLNIDGSVQLDSTGTPVPTYAQADVLGIARVFTGWASNPVGGGGEGSWLYDLDQIHPMVAYQAHHDTDAKVIIGNTTVPAGGTAEADLKIALDTLFNHPNVGPFIGQQLIERLVTSNPSPAYITRVASVFNNNGQGVRGDMSAVFKAILTDPEAISTGGSTYGKLREPLLRVTGLWRAFNAYDSSKLYAESAIMLNSTHWFSQRVLYAPSVFNFFRPDYQRAGAMADAGMVVPEFQITNESTLIDTQNELSTLAYQYVDSQGNSHAGTQLDTSKFLNSSNVLLHVAQWESFAANPTTLVQKLNLVLMAGQMSTAMQNTLITYATQIPADTPWARVAETASLILSSPQYAVQR